MGNELGAFGKLNAKGFEVRVTLSSAHNVNGRVEDLLSRTRQTFGTNDQTSTNAPWMSLTADGVMVCPEAFGVMHGWNNDSNVCKSFVVEGRVGEGSWVAIRSFTATPLSGEGQVYELPTEASSSNLCGDKCYFDSFRLRMTGPDSLGQWYLMVSWFDILGHAMSKTSVEGVQALWSREGSEIEQTGQDRKR